MDIETFVTDPPKLHLWGDHWSTGGFNADHLTKIYALVKEELGTESPNIIETGAGNSTIVFLLAKAASVVSASLDEELGVRIYQYCVKNGIDVSPLNYVAGRSELTLPLLHARNRINTKFDLALIDGAHGWPSVFVDFCYLNAMLRHNGLLLVDDTQLYSVAELARFLDEQPHFARVGQVSKLCIWRKVWDHEFLPDFGAQPYILRAGGQPA